MGRKSLVEMLLTEEDRASFDKLVAAGRLSVDGLADWLVERGYEISRSSAHRYASKYSAVAARMRQSRAVVEAMAAELGDSEMQGRQGRMLVEMTRSLIFDFLAKISEAGEDAEGGIAIDTKDIQQLGKGLAELARAQRLDQDFETKVHDIVRAKLLAEQKAALDSMEVAGGVTAQTLSIIRKTLGIDDGQA